MIQASDLRIGNYLYGLVKNEDFGEVAGRIPFHIKSGRHIDTICKHINQKDLVEPIPLTPEILEKVGFKKERDGTFQIDGLSIRHFVSSFAKVDYNSVGGRYFRTYVSHLHQLQNLYYALTGKELDIKL